MNRENEPAASEVIVEATVTRAMMDAGAAVLLETDVFDDLRERAAKIYRAMHAARR